MREAGADLEGTLDGVIGGLSRPGASREAKALLVDARRLLTVVRNWRTVAPTDAARAQMLERVEALVAAAAAVTPPAPEPARRPSPAPARRPAPEPARRPSPAPREERITEPAPQPTPDELHAGAADDPFLRRNVARTWEEPPPSLVLDPPAAPARTAPPLSDERTFAAPLATEAQASREREVARDVRQSLPRTNGAAPAEPQRTRSLPDLDISGVAQLIEEPQGFPLDETLETRRPAPRVQPSSTPPHGRRRAEVPLDQETSDGVFFPAGEDPGRASPRPPTRSSAPPAGRDRTAIAVRPVPAPESADGRLVMLNDPYSKRAEAYRTLRRKLSGSGAPRTIAVTSAAPAEGKTTCAVNLALAFREASNEKVLLIEANLRAPALAQILGFEPPACFAKQMARHRDSGKGSWTVAEQYEPLHVLAVDPASKTSPLLDPVAFANALEQLVEAGYDRIIVDTPPALGGSDTNLVADAVDGVIVVAWIKKSKKTMVKQAVEQLKPATILGVVTLEG